MVADLKYKKQGQIQIRYCFLSVCQKLIDNDERRKRRKLSMLFNHAINLIPFSICCNMAQWFYRYSVALFVHSTNGFQRAKYPSLLENLRPDDKLTFFLDIKFAVVISYQLNSLQCYVFFIVQTKNRNLLLALLSQCPVSIRNNINASSIPINNKLWRDGKLEDFARNCD